MGRTTDTFTFDRHGNAEDWGSWELWHQIFNLAGRGDNKDWVPLFSEACQRFPESVRYQGRLLFCVYDWYGADRQTQFNVFEEIERHSAAGIPWAECKLGSAYFHGLVVQRDWDKAFECYSKAAEAEQAEAQCRLAGLLRQRRFPYRDMKAAVDLYLNVVVKPYSGWRHEARLACAEILAFGLGVPKDKPLAAYLVEPVIRNIHRHAPMERELAMRIAIECEVQVKQIACEIDKKLRQRSLAGQSDPTA